MSDQGSSPSNLSTAEIVRYLVDRSGVGPGSRVLLCGVSDTALIHRLTNLGLLVTCTHEDDIESESLQQSVPEADCCEGNVPREQFNRTKSGFDLVVVPVAARSECPRIFSRPRLLELAGLLACLHPGGLMAMLGRTGLDDSPGVTHSSKCCLRQLSGLPGRTSIHTFGSQMRLRCSRRRREFAMALQIPDQRLSPFEWDVLAMDAARQLPSECCQNLSPAGFQDRVRAA